MAQQSIGQTTIVWRRSNPLLKGILAALIVFSMAALVALSWVGAGVRSQNKALEQEALKLEAENQGLERKIDALGTESSIRQIAKEELGMVEANTILIQPEKVVN